MLYDPQDSLESRAEQACTGAHEAKAIVRACTRALRETKNPHQRAQLLDIRGNALGDLGQKAQAIADFDAAKQLWPEIGSPYVDGGLVRMETGDYRGAIADYDAMVRMFSDARDFDDRCWARAVAGFELDRALEDCNRSLALSPSDSAAYADRAG